VRIGLVVFEPHVCLYRLHWITNEDMPNCHYYDVMISKQTLLYYSYADQEYIHYIRWEIYASLRLQAKYRLDCHVIIWLRIV